MRVMHISSAKYFGEHERHLVDLCRGLVELGHDVFAGLRPTSDWQHRLDFLPASNILQVSIRNSFGVLSARRIADFVRDKKIEIVHAHIPRDYIPASLACSMAGSAKFVLTRHAPAQLRPFNRFALKNLSKAIAVSSASEAGLRSLFSADKIAAIHNGVDTARAADSNVMRLRENFRALHDIPPDSLMAGIAGELSEVRGQRDFILAALEILKLAPDTRFLIVGRDYSPGRRFRRELKRLIGVFNADASFLWLDELDETEFLAAIDVLVSASHLEGSGTLILEAMSFARPVVATDTEGVAELVGNRELLAAPAEPVELASKIYRLLSDTELRTAAGLALQQRAADSYSLRDMVEATERLYLELK